MAELYKEIGRGTFGVVFTTNDHDTAVKKTFKSSSTLAVEFEHGLAMNFAVTTAAPILQGKFLEPVPQVPWYQSSHGMEKPSARDAWWIKNKSRFPSTNGDDVPNGVFLFQRIPPAPRSLQEDLISRFWDGPEEQETALSDDENKDCMIRPYLQERWAYYEAKGRRRLNNEQKRSLRNFPAFLDDLQEMGIDCTWVARQIALGLAIGHWEAQIDMTDVEFVIAGQYCSRETDPRGHTTPLDAYDKLDNHGNRNILTSPDAKPSGLPKNTRMWLVDFDKCNRVQMWDDTVAEDIRKLALGICANDSYYPSPLPDTRLGWEVYMIFTDTYICAGRHLLEHAFGKVATNDGQLNTVLERPAMVMREWTKIVMNAKKNNERDVFDTRMKIRKDEGWEKPAWYAK